MDALLEEVSALEATMMDNVVIKYEESGRPFRVSTVICPATADDPDTQYVRITLTLTLPDDYPDTSPQVSVDQCRGLSDERISDLLAQCHRKMSVYIGGPVLFAVFETAREWLTASNRPSIPCAICLYDFTENDVFCRTDCFHHFHSHCLARYVAFYQSSFEVCETEEIEDRRLPEWMGQKEDKSLCCPVCRERLSDSLVSSMIAADAPAPELCENDTLLTPSTLPPELMTIQSRLKELSLRRNQTADDKDEERFSPLILSNNSSEVPVSGRPSVSSSSCTTIDDNEKTSENRPKRPDRRERPGCPSAKSSNDGRRGSNVNPPVNDGDVKRSSAVRSDQNFRSGHEHRGRFFSDNRGRGYRENSERRGNYSGGRGHYSNGRGYDYGRGYNGNRRGHRMRGGGRGSGYVYGLNNEYAHGQAESVRSNSNIPNANSGDMKQRYDIGRSEQNVGVNKTSISESKRSIGDDVKTSRASQNRYNTFSDDRSSSRNNGYGRVDGKRLQNLRLQPRMPAVPSSIATDEYVWSDRTTSSPNDSSRFRNRGMQQRRGKRSHITDEVNTGKTSCSTGSSSEKNVRTNR